MAENLPVCVYSLTLHVTRVYAINIDTTEGLVIVSGLMDPPLLIGTIKKLGIETQLLAYEKNPTHDTKKKMKSGNDSPSKISDRSASSLEDNYDSTDGVHHNANYDSQYMRPHGSSWHYPGYGIQSISRGPSYAHGWYPLYHTPQPNTSYVKSTRQTLPYPFDIYGDAKEPEIGNSYHHYFSEENVKACHIM
ncbi:hypothetical protein Ddye_016713 [Dipteronia dyeriana]|uniref:HMA domain-containing protein n=1 Tax=Dipteronia dyeriana TaxID=168575 RepID=A0AAD9U7U8_9ROSI|nr:hypothetical protein Ddye_016713 [Dipteronia dyeriana]